MHLHHNDQECLRKKFRYCSIQNMYTYTYSSFLSKKRKTQWQKLLQTWWVFPTMTAATWWRRNLMQFLSIIYNRRTIWFLMGEGSGAVETNYTDFFKNQKLPAKLSPCAWLQTNHLSRKIHPPSPPPEIQIVHYSFGQSSNRQQISNIIELTGRKTFWSHFKFPSFLSTYRRSGLFNDRFVSH